MAEIYPAVRDWVNKHTHTNNSGYSTPPVFWADTEAAVTYQAYKWAGLTKYAVTPEKLKKLLGIDKPRVIDGRLIRKTKEDKDGTR